MPRISPLPRRQLGLTARLSDFAVRRVFGGPIEGTGIVARSPALLRAGGHMEAYFLSRRRRVPQRVLELVSVRAAMDVGCSFCIDIGSSVASKHGVTAEQLRALSDPAASGLFAPAEVAALELATAMTATPPTVDDALWARLAEHYSDTQLVELTAMIGWENSRARINAAFDIESHGFAAAGACAIATSPANELAPEPASI